MWHYNLSPPELYEAGQSWQAVNAEPTRISDTGAMVAYSGHFTGRVPSDKRVVEEPSSSDNVWWGNVNIKMNQREWEINRHRAIDYLNTRPQLFVVDGYAGWDARHRLKIRVICSRSYHALFMQNMLIRPEAHELYEFRSKEPDFYIYNAGEFPADPLTPGMTSNRSVDVNLGAKEMVILGTQYAGEMKKGVFSVMHYLMPQKGLLSLHSSATCPTDSDDDVTLFFGLSGTGKTTLSADPNRALIGDDEMVWSDSGVFNVEGGCYAKCLNLSSEQEPEIFDSIRFGAILENVMMDPHTRKVDFTDGSITQNTRLCYPIDFMPNAKLPCIAGHPSNIVFLTCDAFGVLPPVSKLSPEQAMYHFITGYTAKVAGTEVGVKEPQATFSSCFGEAFLMWHPMKYATMLADKMNKFGANCWLVNTGWSGGSAQSGAPRMSIEATRKIIDAINNHELTDVETERLPVFNLDIPKTCPGVTDETLLPWNGWTSRDEYMETLNKLGHMFRENFAKYEDEASSLLSAGPQTDGDLTL